MEYKVNINNKTYTLDTLFCKDYAGAGGLYDFALDLIKEIRNTDWNNPILSARKSNEIFKTLYKLKLNCMGYGSWVDYQGGMTAERAERWLAIWQPIKEYFKKDFKVADNESMNDVVAKIRHELENNMGLKVCLGEYRVSHPYIQFFVGDELGNAMTFYVNSNNYKLSENIECYVVGDEDAYPTDEQDLLDILKE